MALTLNLSTSHKTADTESGKRVFLRHSLLKVNMTEVCQQLSCLCFKLKVLHQKKTFRITLFVVDVFSLATRSATHSQRFGDPLLSHDPSAEKH